jgi:serine/threonine-protein kinase
MPEDRARQIGDLAVRKGLITPEQLDEALYEFRHRRSAGSHVPLGEMMVAMGHITRNQLEYLLEAQGGRRGPAQRIAGFELIRKLGEGGMGTVYLARQVSMDRLVALKILRRQLSKDPAYVDRFMREARMAGQLDHQNLVSAIGAGEAGGFHYLAMEYVEGRSLGETMPDGGLPEVFALQLVLQVARGLEHAHRHGIVHRDIKPDNILITGKGVAKLADLGLAKQVEAGTRLTQTGMAVGTADYMSPEQARGVGEADIRSDVYSLGATLYHLVTGRTAFDGPNALVILNKHISEQAPWPQDVNPAVSGGCCMLIARMMAKEPADRYQTPAEVIADLELVIDGKPPRASVPVTGRSSLGASGTVQVVPVTRRRPSRRRRDTRQDPAELTVGERLAAAMRRRVTVQVPMLVGGAAAVLLVSLLLGLLLAVLVRKPPAPVPQGEGSPPGPGVQSRLKTPAPGPANEAGRSGPASET